MPKSDTSGALERSIRLLWELYWEPRGLTASELAVRLDAQRSALYRLIRPLLRNQFIRKDPRKRYYLGFGVTALARAVAEPIEGIALAPLQHLADATGHTAALIADTDGALVTIASVRPTQPGMHVYIPNGFVHDVRSAAGVAIAMTRPEGQSESLEVVDARVRGFAVTPSGELATTAAIPVDIPMLGSAACVMVASLTTIDVSVVQRELCSTAEQLGISA